MAKKPLSPTTEALYNRILIRAFGDLENTTPNQNVLSWTESNLDLLRAAIRRRWPERSLDPTATLNKLDRPKQYAIKKAPKFLQEEECVAYEQAARTLPDRGKTAIALLPLASALRASEILTITRVSMTRARQTGDLLVLRKGGEEQILSLKNSRALFEDLIFTPAADGRWTLEGGKPRQHQWQILGEMLSPGKKITQYHIFHALIRDVGKLAGIDEALHPHSLRHACATRMVRDGVPIPILSKFLNHANIETTMRYVHATTKDAEKFLREF
jgi:site-specific recombinase XerD